MSSFSRQNTTPVSIDSLLLGGGNPIVIQAMTSAPAHKVSETLREIGQLYRAGAEMVRIAIIDNQDAESVQEIRKKMPNIPLVGDFHFNGDQLLQQHPDMARTLSKWRINPGNVGEEKKFEIILALAKKYQKPIRIGGNGGSLDAKLLTKNMEENAVLSSPKSAEEVQIQTLVESVLLSAQKAKECEIPSEQIVLSVKMSSVSSMLTANRFLAQRTNLPIHLGLTEAGFGRSAIVSSSIALGILLQEGIGDTIRVSLTSKSAHRHEEIRVCRDVLQALNLRSFSPKIVSCPGCGRTESKYFQKIVETITKALEEKTPEWSKQYPSFSTLKIAIMGCLVNGIGEAKDADIGLFFQSETSTMLYKKGKKERVLSGENMTNEFLEEIKKILNIK